jgi:DNA-binding MarR family transcriptional regulator
LLAKDSVFEVMPMFLNRSMSNFSTELFQLNNRLIATCDELVSDIGLSTARLQVLGVIAMSSVPETVPQIARRLGLTKQAVQWQANEMERDGHVRFETNPRHPTSRLVLFTAKGQVGYSNAVQRLEPLVIRIGAELGSSKVDAATAILKGIHRTLQNSFATEDMPTSK